ncbi:MAG: YceI family protein [Bacteroidales bacterium]
MKRLIIISLLMISVLSASGQKYMTKSGFISFFSHTPMEDIKGDNNQVASVLDTSTGDLVFQVLIKSFHFDKTLLEEHFNENYMESDKFPKANFKGKITNLSSVDFSKNGSYEVTVEGDLTIRDVAKKMSVKGIVEVVTGGVNANAKFIIEPEDFNIKIPSVVRENIAKTVEVTVAMKYAPV